MDFELTSLLGAPYRGGSVLLRRGTQLFSSAGNRVTVLDLASSEASTLPGEAAGNLQHLALSPSGLLLLAVDEGGKALLVNVQRRVVLHRFSFKAPVTALAFSPDGAFFAAGVGRLLQVWHTPGTARSVTPLRLHRAYAAGHDRVAALEWSPDGRWIAVASRDLLTRVFSLEALPGFSPPKLGGHRDAPLGAFFYAPPQPSEAALGLYTVSRDGALCSWRFVPEAQRDAQGEAEGQEAGPGAAEGLGREPASEGGLVGEGDEGEAANAGDLTLAPKRRRLLPSQGSDNDSDAYRVDRGRWYQEAKHFFLQTGAKVTCCSYHSGLGLLLVGFSSGIFGLYQMPAFVPLHLLSVSAHPLSSVAFNEAGDWVALGSARLGQLVVWEWRSESYVLKLQGHFHDVDCLAFSPDGLRLATGASDCKVKVWSLSSGVCVVTLAEHTLPVTAVAFLPSGTAVLSASLDGTVRAFDLKRYRCFRTLTGPTAVQLASLAVDPSGEIVCAAAQDDFQIYVWSMKTGRLLEVLGGHDGPVHCLAFSPMQGVLVSGSWDGTCRLWDVFGGKGNTETLRHNHSVLALAMRPDSRQLACSTLDGQIQLWNPLTGDQEGFIEGRRDLAGGRLATDRRAAAQSSLTGKHFLSLSYSADGSVLLAGGNSRYVCLYDTADRVLLRRVELTANRSLDGVMDVLNSKRMTDAGPLDLLDTNESEEEEEEGGVSRQRRAEREGHDLPGALPNKGRASVRASCVRFSPTGQAWAAATTEGVAVFAHNPGLLFDPSELDLSVTPEAVEAAVAAGEHAKAVRTALVLNEPELLAQALLGVPPEKLPIAAAAVPVHRLPALLAALARLLDCSPELELVLLWCQVVLVHHGRYLLSPEGAKQNRATRPALQALLKGLTHLHQDLGACAHKSTFLLKYLLQAPKEGASATPPQAPPANELLT